MSDDAVPTSTALRATADPDPTRPLDRPFAHYAQAPPPDPNLLIMPIFIAGSVALALQLVGYVPAAVAPTAVPIALAATGLGLFFCTIWAAWLRRSFDAGVTGVFAAFWLSFAIYKLGMYHNWYDMSAAQQTQANKVFDLTWAIVIVLLVIGSLYTTRAFAALLCIIELAVVLLLLGTYFPGTNMDYAAGSAILAYCVVGTYIFSSSCLTVFGCRAYPLGPPLLGRSRSAQPAPTPFSSRPVGN